MSESEKEARAFWTKQKTLRKAAKVGDWIHFGVFNGGTAELVLPVIKRSDTQFTCSNGDRTERVMIQSGRVIGYARRTPVKMVTPAEAEALLKSNAPKISPKRGGAREGAGRTPLPESERTVVATIRLTPARRDKLKMLGSEWLSPLVDKAVVKGE